jgi:hypothetical protein
MLEPRPEAVSDDDPIRGVHEQVFAPSLAEARLVEARGCVSYAEALSLGG